ncbi:MAG TPA: tripartite tricarboxylate transporter substrate binding protein [Ramlibacter sp.]|nr:tripartite tricarboxylate transporter substrate binding protein [Ramlibacter sp.]
MLKRRMVCGLLLAAAPLLAPAQQAAFPGKPLRIVVGFPAGGGADVVARDVAAKMGDALGQSVVVENRAGAGGNIAAQFVAQSPADGYTLYLATASNVVNTAAAALGTMKLGYDLQKDLVPVVQLVRNQNVIVANPSLPVSDVQELIRLARSKPGALNFGVMSPTSQLAGELFRQTAKVEITDVPYKGAAPVITDLIGGQVELGILDVAVVLPHIQSGKLKALGVTSTARFEGLPRVPTVAESGLPGFEAGGWLGLMAPAGTPPQAIAAIQSAASKALADNEVKAKLARLGVTPAAGSPEQFGAYMRAEVTKWQRVMRDGRINLGN